MTVGSARRPWWQQATALVTVSAGGVITGLNFAPGTAATMTTANAVPIHLLALDRSAAGDLGSSGEAGGGAHSGDAVLRPAIVNIARHYLQQAQGKTPAEMEALIWGSVSTDGADHGHFCAAFASLTLELAAQAVGQQSWVTGGDSYPWPLHSWADVRVDPNASSMAVISMQQDAQAHDRWHPLGDRYVPQPGDWVLFDHHVEVVTSYSDGVLHTIGANAAPDYTVDAHSFSGSLAADGVAGFVDNGNLARAAGSGAGKDAGTSDAAGKGTSSADVHASGATGGEGGTDGSTPKDPTTKAASPGRSGSKPATGAKASGQADIPGLLPGTGASTQPGSARPGSGQQSARVPGTSEAGTSGAGTSAAGSAGTKGGGSTQRRASGSRSQQPAAQADIPGFVAPGVSQASASPAARGGAGKAAGNRPDTAKSSAAIPGATPAPSAPPQPSAPRQPSAAKPSTPKPSTPKPSTPKPSTSKPSTSKPSTAKPSTAKPSATTPSHSSAKKPYQRHSDSSTAGTPGTSFQQTFISTVAPGAMAAQQRWGVPAAVTIAQAIEESAWGQSSLAATYHNLFGIKGAGPAGSVLLPTQEFENGEWVTIDAPFRRYHNDAESISDHAELLATSEYYTRAMADRNFPDAFANDLTGVYATDPNYGANLIALMKLYNLYQYDVPTTTTHAPATTTPTPTPTPSQAPTPAPSASPSPSRTPSAPAASSPSTSATPSSSATPGTSATPDTSATPSSSAMPRTSASPAATGAPVAAGTPAATGTPAPKGGSRRAGTSRASRQGAAQAAIPGLPGSYGEPASYGASAKPAGSRQPGSSATGSAAVTSAQTMAFSRPVRLGQPGSGQPGSGQPGATAPSGRQGTPVRGTRGPGIQGRAPARTAERLYVQELPDTVRSAFFTSARTPIARAELMYKDIASQTGISWKLLAACDWMQCQSQPHLSPVHGERLGTLNTDGTVYTTKSAALAQCAADLIELAFAVYRIDLTIPRRMSVQELADVFAAFRWGGLLRRHRVSSLEFPYSVEGLTEGQMRMRWPAISEPNAPDKPGTKFRMPFGAVPLVLSLNYRATM